MGHHRLALGRMGDGAKGVALTPEQLQALKQRDEAVAVLSGGVAAPPGPSIAAWVVSDTGADPSGEPIDATESWHPARFVQRGTTVLGLIDDPWAALGRVAPTDLKDWKEENKSGVGRDPRVMPIVRGWQDHWCIGLRDAMAAQQKRVLPAAGAVGNGSSEGDSPSRGLSTGFELMTMIRAMSETTGTHHGYW
eukprot:9013421-Pyramimonas_sp.AAC.1